MTGEVQFAMQIRRSISSETSCAANELLVVVAAAARAVVSGLHRTAQAAASDARKSLNKIGRRKLRGAARRPLFCLLC